MLVLTPSMVWLPVNAWSNPSGGSVIIGDVQINDPSGNTLSIEQFSDRAVIEWENFSIDSGQLTQFFQPGSSSAVLNRVVGGSPSAINGALRGNGNVWLINQNGVVVGPSGTVDVFGFVASSLDVSNEAFMAGGDMNFNGGIGDTVNFGTINAAGGDVFLVGRTVANHGVIGAVDGTVGLAAGNNVLFKSKGGERLFVSAGEGSVTNTGEITSAMAELKAHGNVGALAVNNTGAIRAGGVNNSGGRVVLSAAQGNVSTTGEITVANGGGIEITSGMGEIQIGGILSANSNAGPGGSINVTGRNVNLLADANVRASGTEGGTVQIGGNTNGGQIQVQSGATVRADGSVGAGGVVDLRAGDIVIYGNSTLGADGETEGGLLSLTGSGLVSADGVMTANGRVGNGGRVAISGENVLIGATGAVFADGAENGGSVAVSAVETATIAGQVNANGQNGDGGSVLVAGTDVEVGVVGSVSANGASGGTINLAAAEGLTVFGTVSAVGSEGSGGLINATGDEVEIGPQALIDASGVSGGDVNIGGGLQGRGALRNSSKTTVAAGAVVRANGSDGNGGNVVIWSDGETEFRGRIEADGAGVGNGGFVEVSGANELTFAGNVSTGSENGAIGTLLLDPTDITIVDGAAGDVSPANTFTDGLINNLMASSNLIINTAGAGDDLGNILVDNDVRIEWGAPNSNSTIGNARYNENFNSFTLLATGNITVEGHIISNGAGNVNLFAGWDGTTGNAGAAGSIGLTELLTYGTPSSDTTRGTVQLNTTVNDQAVQVGSRFGETNVVARDLTLEVPLAGSHRYAHLGYRPTTNVESGGAGVYGLVTSSTYREGANGAAVGSIDLRATDFGQAVIASGTAGDINVNVQESVRMLGEQGNGDGWKYTQIGHGGNGVNDVGNGTDFQMINADSSGNVTVNAGLAGGPSIISMQAGREGGYSRIGHGGMANPASADDARGAGAFMGDISVTNHGSGDIVAQGNEGNGWAGYVQIGNGGFRNARTADIEEGVNTGNSDVRGFDANFGDGSAGQYNSAANLLGHRAFNPTLLTPDGNPVGDRGNIVVNATDGNILFQTGTSSRSGAILGHGGHERPGNIGLFNANGETLEQADITVRGNSVLFLNQPLDGDGQRYVKLGHGGYQSPGNAAGDIVVEAREADVRFQGGGGGESYAQLGHGGSVRWWNTEQEGVQGTLRGDIDVTAANNINFRSGTGWADRMFSQIGHGGTGWIAYSRNPDANLDNLLTGHHGNITVRADGSIDFMSGQPDNLGASQDRSVASNQAFSMIGHGGYLSLGDHYGTIDVEGGDIRFESIGGLTANRSDGSDQESRGDTNFVMIGHGGRDNDFEGGGNRGGDQEKALGGLVGTARDSTINVTATTGDIVFIAPQVATIADQKANLESFTTGRWSDEEFISERAVHSFAVIGHGGNGGANYNGDGLGGDINVTASSGDITFVGSDFQQAYNNDNRNPIAQRNGVAPGVDGLLDLGADGIFGTADDGPGAADNVRFNSRRSEQNHTGIGLGGISINGTKTGDITVLSGGNISLEGGLGRHDQSRIGHGGWDSDGPNGNGSAARNDDVFRGSIDVRSTGGSVTLQGGLGGARDITDLDGHIYSYAQIGHGGRSSSGSTIGNDDHITVYAGGGDVEVHAGHGYTDNWALIGHGGHDSRAGFMGGNIDVYALNNISIASSESAYGQAANFAQIGHGGWNVDQEGDNNARFHNGTIVEGQIDVVAATGDIVLLAGRDNPSIASGGVGNFRYEGDAAPFTGWQGDATNPIVAHPTTGLLGDSDGYMYAGRGNLTERPADSGTDGVDGDDGVRAQGGFATIGHGGQHNNTTITNQNINVTAGNDFVGVAGEFRDARVGVGHGGDIDAWGGNRSRRRTIATGDIDLTVGGDLELHAGSGDNAVVKIGNGSYQPTSDRSRVEGGSSNFTNNGITTERTTRWEGNVAVKVGGSAVLDADDVFSDLALDDGRDFANGSSTYRAIGLVDSYAANEDYNRVLIGHRDTADNRASHGGVTNAVGNTYFAVSRDNPTATGTGTLTTRVSTTNANGVVFSSADNGLFGETRVYAPSRTSVMNIAPGTLFNATSYQGTATGGNQRADEYEATEFTFNLHTPDTTDIPVGTFTPEDDPNKAYAIINQFGRYGMYLANPNDLFLPGGGLTPVNAGGGDPLPFIRKAKIIAPPVVIVVPTEEDPVIPPTPTVAVGFDGTPIIFVGGTIQELQTSISETLDSQGVERFDGNDSVDDQIGDALAEFFKPKGGEDGASTTADYSSVPVGSTGSGFTSAAVSGSANVMTPLTVALQTRRENGRVTISLALIETFGTDDELRQTTSRAQTSAPAPTSAPPAPAPAAPEDDMFGGGDDPFGAGGDDAAGGGESMEDSGADGFDSFFQ